MVVIKGKSEVGSTRALDHGTSRKSVGSRSFKVYSETEPLKVGDGVIKSAKNTTATSRRNALVANKGIVLKSVSNPKVGFKSMEKSSSKYGSSANLIGRKALTDVSNTQGNIARNIGHSGSKAKVVAGSSTKVVNVTSRKTFPGRVQGNPCQADVQFNASKRGMVLKPPIDDQKSNPNVGRRSVVTEARIARKSLLPTRMSLPVPRRVSRTNTSNTKDNARISETTEEKSALPAKATTSGKYGYQPSNARSHILRTRVSDGFVQMVQTRVNLQASSRKSTMPLVKTARKASNSQGTLKSESKSGVNKLVLAASTSSQNEEAVSVSVPENSTAGVSNDANQELLSCNGDINLSTESSEFVPKKKSTRRKSYTSSLIERSKILKESGESMKQDNLPSIDNDCNQLEVSEYIDEIYQYYWGTEAHNSALANYMSIQTDITPHMRGILNNWLIEVHLKFDLMPETLYLTITLLDQYLSLVTIKKSEMQLVGLTALLLASKYEDFWHPRVKDLISISAESYTRDQMLEMEKLILRKLKFRLNSPTPYVFMVRFLKAAQSDMKLEHLAFFLIELCLVEYEALAFKPSLLCASAIYLARCTLQVTPTWTPLLRKHARYEVPQIRGCAEMILKFHKAAGKGKLKVTYEKYLRPERSGVAAVKPLDSLPL